MVFCVGNSLDHAKGERGRLAALAAMTDGSLQTCSERLSFWPYRYEELVAQLQNVGLTVETTTIDPTGSAIFWSPR